MRLGAVIVVAAGLITAVPAAGPDEGSSTARAAYEVGVEDVLHVSVWGEPAIDLSVPVRPDGKISLPLVNDIEAAGRTVEEIRQAIAEELARFIREPAVTVVVEQINSFRVYILGEVNSQGVYTFRRPTRLLQALAAAGGLTRFSKQKVIVAREAYGTPQLLEIDCRKLLRGEDMKSNIFLMPGDTVLVN
ncbi:MAG: hypothetical protein D6718_11600 [Acidobacteria bacterium]|nr:MAG: hypothetical protein D6718_11600 [Acidobacteriota bacterium]